MCVSSSACCLLSVAQRKHQSPAEGFQPVTGIISRSGRVPPQPPLWTSPPQQQQQQQQQITTAVATGISLVPQHSSPTGRPIAQLACTFQAHSLRWGSSKSGLSSTTKAVETSVTSAASQAAASSCARSTSFLVVVSTRACHHHASQAQRVQHEDQVRVLGQPTPQHGWHQGERWEPSRQGELCNQ